MKELLDYYNKSMGFIAFLKEKLPEGELKNNLIKSLVFSFDQIFFSGAELLNLEKKSESIFKKAGSFLISTFPPGIFPEFDDLVNPSTLLQEYSNCQEISNPFDSASLMVRIKLANLSYFYYILASHLDLCALICLYSKRKTFDSLYPPNLSYIISKVNNYDTTDDNFFELLKNKASELKFFDYNYRIVKKDITDEKLKYLINVRDAFTHRNLNTFTFYFNFEEMLIFFTFLPFQECIDKMENIIKLIKQIMKEAESNPHIDIKNSFERNGIIIFSFNDALKWLNNLIDFYDFIQTNLFKKELVVGSSGP